MQAFLSYAMHDLRRIPRTGERCRQANNIWLWQYPMKQGFTLYADYAFNKATMDALKETGDGTPIFESLIFVIIGT